MILPEHEAKELLEKAQVPIVPTRIIDSLQDAADAAEQMGYPLVLKLSSSRYSHKTEVGGVFLNLEDRSAVARAYDELIRLRQKLHGEAAIIVEPMAPPGAEFYIGVQRHDGFGLVISLGLGGVFLELFKDVSFRLLPARRSDFCEMLNELKTWPKLRKGFRNLPPVGDDHLIDLMDKVAGLSLAREDIVEMDMNPVMAYADRALVVDARIVTSG